MTVVSRDIGPLEREAIDRAETDRMSAPAVPAPVTPPAGLAEAVLALQRSAGNRATGRLLRPVGAAARTGARKLLRSKLKDFPNVKSYTVECLPYKVQRRGHSHYIMIGPGDGWHISIPVRAVPRDLYNHDFGEYHVTDPDGNHYNYTSSHVRNGADGLGDKWKTADALVSTIFGVTPTFVDLPQYNKALLALIGAGKWGEHKELTRAVAAIKRREPVSDDVAYQKYLAGERGEPAESSKRKRETAESSPTDESKGETKKEKDDKEEKAPRTTTPSAPTAEVGEEEEEEGAEGSSKKT